MSKNTKIGIIAGLINTGLLILFIYVFVFLFMDIDKERTILEKEDFIQYVENMGCKIIDVQGEKNYDDVLIYLITDSESCPYYFSYAILNDTDKENSFLSNAVYDVAKNNSNVTGSSKVNIFSNYLEYSTSGYYYKVITKNKNSLLYASVLKEYREDVRNTFNDFGYLYAVNYDYFTLLFILSLLYLICIFVCFYKLLKKLTDKGWIAFVPFYNFIILCRCVMGSSWYLILLFVPIVNFIFILTFLFKIGRIFGKNFGYSSLVMLLPIMFIPILAMDNSECINKV